MVGVGTPCKRPISWTTVTSGSISIARPRSRSCSIEVLCAPTLRGALDPALDIDAEPDALLVADLLRFQHHGPGDRARSGSVVITSRVAWVSALIGLKRDVAPQLQPDLVADIVEHRRLKPGFLKQLGHFLDALGALADGSPTGNLSP